MSTDSYKCRSTVILFDSYKCQCTVINCQWSVTNCLRKKKSGTSDGPNKPPEGWPGPLPQICHSVAHKDLTTANGIHVRQVLLLAVTCINLDMFCKLECS